MKLLSESSPHHNIWTKIWEYPEPNCYYALGCDPSGVSTRGHPTVIHVWKDYPRQLVLEERGHAREEVWAQRIYHIARFYNDAYVNVEVYRYGKIIRSMLLNGNPIFGIPEGGYENLYRCPSLEDIKRGKYTAGDSRHFFYEARAEWREQLMVLGHELVASLEPGMIPDKETLLEIREMVRDFKTGRVEGKLSDDRFIADMMAWLILKQEPFDYSLVPDSSPIHGFDEDGNPYINVEAAYEESLYQPTEEIIYG